MDSFHFYLFIHILLGHIGSSDLFKTFILSIVFQDGVRVNDLILRTVLFDGGTRKGRTERSPSRSSMGTPAPLESAPRSGPSTRLHYTVDRHERLRGPVRGDVGRFPVETGSSTISRRSCKHTRETSSVYRTRWGVPSLSSDGSFTVKTFVVTFRGFTVVIGILEKERREEEGTGDGSITLRLS